MVLVLLNLSVVGEEKGATVEHVHLNQFWKINLQESLSGDGIIKLNFSVWIARARSGYGNGWLGVIFEIDF